MPFAYCNSSNCKRDWANEGQLMTAERRGWSCPCHGVERGRRKWPECNIGGTRGDPVSRDTESHFGFLALLPRRI